MQSLQKFHVQISSLTLRSQMQSKFCRSGQIEAKKIESLNKKEKNNKILNKFVSLMIL
jgi:hypothetical protein